MGTTQSNPNQCEAVTAGAYILPDNDPNTYFVVLTSGSSGSSTDLHTLVTITKSAYSRTSALSIIQRMGVGSKYQMNKPRTAYLVKSYGFLWDHMKWNWPAVTKTELVTEITGDQILRAVSKRPQLDSDVLTPAIVSVDNGVKTRVNG